MQSSSILISKLKIVVLQQCRYSYRIEQNTEMGEAI